jgi:hypothetical protein
VIDRRSDRRPDPETTWTSRDAAIIAPPRRHDVVLDEMDGEIVCVDPVTDTTYYLNRTAYDVFRWCDGRTTTRWMARVLAETYDVEMDDALDDVEEVVELLVDAGLLGCGGDSDGDAAAHRTTGAAA